MRRPIWSVLAALVIMAMIVGCAPAPAAPVDAVPTQPPAGATDVPATAAPERTEPYEVLFWEHAPWSASPMLDKENDYIWKYIRDNYNLDITIGVAPSGPEGNAKLSAMIAAGEIPDFIEAYWTVGTVIVKEFVDQGVLVPIDEYLEATSYLKSFLTAEERIPLTMDGKQYAVAQPKPVENWYTVWIRKDWLDKLGLEVPKTTDDLADVALAFTTGDPDGNGQNDTYGFTASANFEEMRSLFAPFGAHPGKNNIRIEDNEIIYDAFSPQAKEALGWWKAQIDAGVVDPNWSTNNRESWREAVMQGRAGIVSAQFQMLRSGTNPDILGDGIRAANPDAEWIQLPALQGPFGAYVCWQGTLVDVPFWFTRQVESEPGKAEAIMRFFDDMMNPETELYQLVIYGMVDVHYLADETGRRIEIIPAEEVPEDLERNPYWQVFRRGDEGYFWFYKSEPGETWEKQQLSTSEPKIKNVTPLVTAHEAWPDLLAYVQEMHAKFATGEESLDKWDDFVNTALTTYRLQEVLDDATGQLRFLGMLD